MTAHELARLLLAGPDLPVAAADRGMRPFSVLSAIEAEPRWYADMKRGPVILLTVERDGKWSEPAYRMFWMKARKSSSGDAIDAPGGEGPAPAGWQPMETAPHTGKLVDLLNEDCSITQAFWGQRDLQPCWIRAADRHAYLSGDFRFVAWRETQP